MGKTWKKLFWEDQKRMLSLHSKKQKTHPFFTQLFFATRTVFWKTNPAMTPFNAKISNDFSIKRKISKNGRFVKKLRSNYLRFLKKLNFSKFFNLNAYECFQIFWKNKFVEQRNFLKLKNFLIVKKVLKNVINHSFSKV